MDRPLGGGRREAVYVATALAQSGSRIRGPILVRFALVCGGDLCALKYPGVGIAEPILTTCVPCVSWWV